MTEKINIYYDRTLFIGKSGLSESVFCAPFENPKLFEEDRFENNRFLRLIERGKDYLNYTGIEDCDYVIVPYKWDNHSAQTQKILSDAKKYKKQVIALHNDDYAPQVKLSKDKGYLFTTSLEKSIRQENEFSFPAFTGDFFEAYGSKFITNYSKQKSIGFCGAITHPLRRDVLNKLTDTKILKRNFLVSSGFWYWAPETVKEEARIVYYNNMLENCFILCVRGNGNFSYRLYETMMMGRIPVIIDSNQVFPFEKILNYNDFSILIPQNELDNMEIIIDKWLSAKTEKDLTVIQKRNRELWSEYMSPLGWIKNFKKEIIKI